MDRTTTFNTTVSAATHRHDERQFGENIHRNLCALALLHAPTDELRGLLSDDMFVRPNSAAFMHVAHFLFTALDVREFRRTFYWPCRDKAAESKFRTAAVALMNTLIQRHQMPLEAIKMHNVVLPGGLKFMRIVYEFTVLALRQMAAKQADVAEDGGGGGFNVCSALDELRGYQQNANKFLQ